MLEVYPRLFIGTHLDCPLNGARRTGFATVHACQACYRQIIGETALGTLQGSEQQRARRGNDLYLNLVDGDYPSFFSKAEQFDPALRFIEEMRAKEMPILIHCEQGLSRSPSLALLYLATRLGALPTDSFEAAEQKFLTLYPAYVPGYGIWAHLRHYWRQYCADGQRGGAEM